MSKYIKPLPLGEIERIVLWENPGRLTLEKAMVAQAVPPDYGLSGVYYDPDWTLAGHVKVDGRVRSTPKDESGSWGYAWNTGGDMRMVQLPKGGEPYRNYIACKELLTPWDGIDAELTVGKGLQGERGWAALALDGDNLILWATGDGRDGMTLPALREELYKLGAETALALDGGQSVKLRTKDGSVYINDRRRPVTQHYIFIWLKPKKLYRVQVGAFSVKANAERLKDELNGKGYPGFIQEVEA